ncbi:MAG: hypothetical protein JSR59_09510 [Proteobacteria bacterium]|nr:hypothetical protein [Pseudomonadota bacterium]
MNAPLLPEILLGVDTSAEPRLPLASEGVLRYIWESRYGPMLIEVRAGEVYVNGARVQRIRPGAGGPAS